MNTINYPKIEDKIEILQYYLYDLYDIENSDGEIEAQDLRNLLNAIIKTIEEIKNTNIPDFNDIIKQTFNEIKYYIRVEELNRVLDCLQYDLSTQIDYIKETNPWVFSEWKLQENKCMLIELLKSHSFKEQEQLLPEELKDISDIWNSYFWDEREKFLEEFLNSTSFKVGAQIWSDTPKGVKDGKNDLLINLLKKGLESTYNLENDPNFENWVNENINSLQNFDARLFDDKILRSISLEGFKKILLMPEIHSFLSVYKDNTLMVKFILNSLKKDDTKEKMINLLEQIGEYQKLIGKVSFEENTTNEEIESFLRTFIIYKTPEKLDENEIPLTRKFEIAGSNFELQLKLWEVLPGEIKKDNIHILDGILKEKFKGYFPENLSQNFSKILDYSISMSKGYRYYIDPNGNQVFQTYINLLQQMNSPILNPEMMEIFPFDKMIQILSHPVIEEKLSSFKDNSQALKIIEYLINNSTNWKIELNNLLENMSSPRYNRLMREIVNNKVDELPLKQLIHIFGNSKNHFIIETMDDAEHFDLIRKKQCLEILDGENPEYMSSEYGQLDENEKMRFALLELSFGIDIDEARELVKKYGADIEKITVLDEATGKIKHTIETVKMILSSEIDIQNFYLKNKERLLNIDVNESFYGFAKLEAECLNLYANLYNQSLGIEQEKIRTIDYKGKQIEVHEITGNFNALIRLEQGIDVENEASEFIEKAFKNISLQINGNCKTYIGQNFINFVQAYSQDSCLLGYIHCDKNSLHYAAPTNIVSENNNVAFSPASAKSNTGNGIQLRMSSGIIDNSRTGINETTTQKWSYNKENGEIEVDSPDFIVYVQETNDTDLDKEPKWSVAQMIASKLGKPILIIPREKCAQREQVKIEEIKQKLLGNIERGNGESDEFLIQRLIVEFNNNREGIITSPALKEKYFTEEQHREIMGVILEKINYLKQFEPEKYDKLLPKVCQIFRDEIDKYHITNWDRIDAKIDSESTRKHLEPYEQFLMEHETIKLSLSDKEKNELDTLMQEIGETDFYNMNEVHSIEHIQKVMLFSAVLAKNEGLSSEDKHLLLVAAAFHDSGRKGQDGDYNHAEASAREIENYLINNPKNPFGIDESNIGILKTVIEYHEYIEPVKGKTNNQEICRLCGIHGVSTEDFDRVVKLCELLKDADALDRARFGLRSDNVSALNAQYLKSRSAKSIRMIKFSEDVNLSLSKSIGEERLSVREIANLKLEQEPSKNNEATTEMWMTRFKRWNSAKAKFGEMKSQILQIIKKYFQQISNPKDTQESSKDEEE